LPRAFDDDVAFVDNDRLGADLERRLARFHHEDLGIGMTVELRADPGSGGDEDDRERDVAVLRPDELVRVLRVLQVVQGDDGALRRMTPQKLTTSASASTRRASRRRRSP